MASTEELLAQLVEVAQEQLRWQRAAVLPDVRKTVDQTLTTTQLRKAFELCDGSKSSVEVAKEVKVSKQAFSAWTRRWRDSGIAYETPERTIKHLTTLKSLGLPVDIDEPKRS